MSILDFFYPKRCAGCGKEGTYFCPACILSSKPHFPQVCPVCEKPAAGGITHQRCREEFTPDGLFVVWRYAGAPRKLIIKLKYKYVAEMALTLASAAAGNLAALKGQKHVLVPIPLHWARKNWRGFNHTEEVGKILAKFMAWRVAPLVLRSRWTSSQVGLWESQRRQNVRDAFEINSKSYSLMPSAYSLILFDDVWTSGSTMKEAAKALKKASFRHVFCLTLTR